jgi:methyl-accepting chemotaxis protein
MTLAIKAAGTSRLGRRISVGVVSIVALVICAAISSIIAYNLRRNDNLITDRVITYGATTSSIAGALLARNETGGMRALLSSSQAERDIVSAIVLDPLGKPIAQYQRENDTISKLDPAEVVPKAASALPLGKDSLVHLADYVDTVAPIMDPRDPTNRLGTLAWRFDKLPWKAADRLEIIVVAAVGVGVLVVLALTLVFLLRRATLPLTRLTEAVQALQSGARDITIPALERKDEIGALARVVDAFRDGLAERDTAESNRDRDMARRAKELETRNRLVETLSANTSASIASLKEGSAWLNNSADSLGELASRTVKRVVAASEAVQSASRDIIGVAQSAEEMARSIAEIDQQSSIMKNIAGDASIRVRDTQQTIAGLSERAGEIDLIVTLIQSIAEQTNLLALNATIEAARAGDAGRGFAVVAQEVKGLATQTAEATAKIATQIHAVQDATARAVDAIRGIADSMGELDGSASGIAAAMTEQSSTTAEIARSVGTAAQAASLASEEFSALETSAEETDNAANGVRVAADAVAQEADTIRKAVDGFLGGVRTATLEAEIGASKSLAA